MTYKRMARTRPQMSLAEFEIARKRDLKEFELRAWIEMLCNPEPWLPGDYLTEACRKSSDIIHETKDVAEHIHLALEYASDSLSATTDPYGADPPKFVDPVEYVRTEVLLTYEEYLQKAEVNANVANNHVKPSNEIIQSLYEFIELCRAECRRREHPLKRFVKEGKEALSL